MIKISKKTLTDLEFYKICEQLSEHCLTEKGRQKALDLRPFKNSQKILLALGQTQEYKSSAVEADRIPNHFFDDVDNEIYLLNIKNSVLEARGFQNIAALSSTANTLLKFFNKHQELYPKLQALTEPVMYTDILIKSIYAVLDRFGEIKNDASDQLAEIRRDLAMLQQQIDSSFTADMSRYHSSGFLDDIRESVIDNHRVLAVLATHRRKVKGNILGRSKTGSIVFIQPQNTLRYSREYNNLKFDEKEEINRILRALSDEIRPYRELLIDYQDLLSAIDLVAAKVKYAARMNAVLPKVTKKRELDLKAAYHPLLYLNNAAQGKKTYPQDIKLSQDQRIIVISGPNAGGKSITLKTVGLLQLMLQSGLFIPVHEYSHVCLFKTVLSDIGDHQSIENHLSTYSYRLKNMRYFLQKCDKHSLFLIDEFGTGTDPELGGALAETFLEVFFERESFGIITTHYANLKKMANETEGIQNANMRFDNSSLEPEFKLQMGEAGSSFTFEVAQKNGIPYSLINRSKKKVARGKIRFDKSIAKLQQERSKLVKTTKQLNEEKHKATQHKETLSQKADRIQQKLEDFQQLYDSNQQLIYLGKKFTKLERDFSHSKNKKQFIAELLKLAAVESDKRQSENKKQARIKRQREERIQREAEKKLETIRQKKAQEKQAEVKRVEEKKKKEIDSLGPNDRVRLEGSKAIGTIDKIEKGKVIINYGLFTTEAPIEKIELVSHSK